MGTQLEAKGTISTDTTGNLITAAITSVTPLQVKVVIASSPFVLSKNINVISVKHVSSGKHLSPVLQNFESLGSNQFRYTFANPGNIVGLAPGQSVIAQIAITGAQEWQFYTAQTSAALAQANASNIFVTAAGTNTYTAAPSPAITAYTAGLRVRASFTNANTTAATLNLNGLGAKGIVKGVSTALASGDLVANKIYELTYDGTNFQVLGL